MDKQAFLRAVEKPSPEYRGKTRWWWFGCKVDRDELCYELDEMLKAGIGGVEIQMLYALSEGDDTIAYFSPEYFDLLAFTAREVKKRGMTFDLTLGSSWPYGGPFVPFSKSARTVIPLELNVHGPTTFEYDFTNRIAGEIVGCVLGKVENCEMLPETAQDISAYLTDTLLYNWPWGTRLSGVPIPEGDYRIAVFVASQFGEHVLEPMRGSEGYVIDHNDRECVRFFLEHAGTPLVERLGRGTVDNFFCDSLEVFGHNWTMRIYEEFEKRRGYSLKPYIYALWGEMKGITDKIRCDFHRTVAELTQEGFFEEMTAWCHEVGSQSRIQAHGTWGDVLSAYGAADIPEGETFSAWDKFSVNTVHRRLASSAAHLYRKRVVSNESFTWLRFPRFCETPENIKIAADSIFVDGMNQIVNHGYAYSPRKGEKLMFYASSQINHDNTWWEYYPYVGRYINRVSEYLQKGEPVAELCIYLPQSDIWAENPLSNLHMCMKLEEKIGTDTVDALARAGYWFDYINDEALCRFRDYDYKTLIIMETDRMPAGTARQVLAFAKEGGRVICAGKMPHSDCGLLGSFDVGGLFESMRRDGLLTFVENKHEALLACLKAALVPDLCVSEGQNDIGYVHRRDGASDYYFLANMSLTPYQTTVSVRSGHEHFILVDPMTAEEVSALQYEKTGEDIRIRLSVKEGQSLMLVFDPSLPAARTEALPRRTGRVLDLSRGWRLHVDEPAVDCLLPVLNSFEKLEVLRFYSGEAVYTRELSLSADEMNAKRMELSLEEVNCAATVYVNGEKAGDLVFHPFCLDLKGFLKEGRNLLEIRVKNLLINRYIDPAFRIKEYPDRILDEWPYFPQQLIKERGKRLSNWRELELVKEPLPSGLSGAVTLRLSRDICEEKT